MAITNYFAAEPLIINRIKALAITGLNVHSASFIAGVTDLYKLCPFVVVEPGASETSDGAEGRLQEDTQQWRVTVGTQHSKDAADVNTSALAAGAIILPVLQTLVGWQPSADYKPLVLIERGQPYYEPGYAEFPFEFETRFSLRGE